MQPWEWISQTCWVKEARHKWVHIAWFHLCEVCKQNKFSVIQIIVIILRTEIVMGKMHKEAFWDIGSILYFDLSCGSLGMLINKNSINYTPKINAHIFLYLNRKEKFVCGTFFKLLHLPQGLLVATTPSFQ